MPLTLALAPGMDHEAVREGRVLALCAAQGSPEFLLAEGNRVIRNHRLSKWVSQDGRPDLLHVTCQQSYTEGQWGGPSTFPSGTVHASKLLLTNYPVAPLPRCAAYRQPSRDTPRESA